MRHTWEERWMFLQAAVALVLARLAVAVLAFRLSTRVLGLHAEGPDPAAPRGHERAAVVGWAVDAASRRLPWPSNCLVQALAAALLLRCHSISATLSLGVTRDNAARISAHAWLSCGEVIVTGGHSGEFEELQRYVLA